MVETYEREFLDHLFVNGIPRRVRCYDNPNNPVRYTIVFKGHYRAWTEGLYVYLRTTAEPYKSECGLRYEASTAPVDSSTAPASHRKLLGFPIPFQKLPPSCQRVAMGAYCDLWNTLPPPLPPLLPNFKLKAWQRDALRRWLEARETVDGFAAHYRLGESYLAPGEQQNKRGLAERHTAAYVELDHATARLLPELASRSDHEVEALLSPARQTKVSDDADSSTA